MLNSTLIWDVQRESACLRKDDTSGLGFLLPQSFSKKSKSSYMRPQDTENGDCPQKPLTAPVFSVQGKQQAPLDLRL